MMQEPAVPGDRIAPELEVSQQLAMLGQSNCQLPLEGGKSGRAVTLYIAMLVQCVALPTRATLTATESVVVILSL